LVIDLATIKRELIEETNSAISRRQDCVNGLFSGCIIRCQSEKCFCFGGELGFSRNIIGDDRRVNFNPKTWFESGRIVQDHHYRGLTDTHYNILIGNSAGLGHDLNRVDEQGQTPAFVACLLNETNCGKVLLEKGADFSTPSGNGLTPLFVLMQDGNRELSLALLDSDRFGNVNIASELRETPLHWAVMQNFPSAVEKLILRGADCGIGRQKDGLLPIHQAAKLGYYECLVYLTSSQRNIAAATPAGLTALHLAAQSSLKCVRHVLKVCGIDLNKQDILGDTAAMKAIKSGRYDIYPLLDPSLSNETCLR
jgi:hypothetical protein